MDIKLKNISHHILTKVLVFILVVLSFYGIAKALIDLKVLNDGNYDIVLEDNYFHSSAFVRESEQLANNLIWLIDEYKSEEHILSGATISEDENKILEQNLLEEEFRFSTSYDPEWTEEKTYEVFKKEYADKIAQKREELIKEDLKTYYSILQTLDDYQVPYYYVSDGQMEYTNSSKMKDKQFKSYPAYFLFEKYQREIFPQQAENNKYLHHITDNMDTLDPENMTLYIAYPDSFLNTKMTEWQDSKKEATNSFYTFIVSVAGLFLSFIYLVIITGKQSFTDEKVHLQAMDKLYNDINLVLLFTTVIIWVTLIEGVFEQIENMLPLITLPLAAVGLLLVLSLVKHVKNRTIFKHTLIWKVLSVFVKFIRDVYNSGGVAVKTVLIVVGYPIIVALTFFIFPVTLGLAAWFAYRKIKEFQMISEGVEKIKDGDIHHHIMVDGKGEFPKLAENINRITDGLKMSVESELKSERLKTELITNVSHDIRNPLTSIISYVDLLKAEKDPGKIKEYIDVLDQKSKRLKVLTDDLFEASKASSGNIPVNLEQIDIVSLVNQGLGEVSEKIEALDLDVKLNYPKEKPNIEADGKLLWRSIENLLTNIFKYALRGSRVYIDVEEIGNEVVITFKNISAYELNISADELMERFKRGDESRLSQGSGLGLSIAKSLIEMQKGRFSIQIDGDLFKAIISLPKHQS